MRDMAMARLERWLKDNDLTQAEFGRRIGVSQPTVSDWISGVFSPSLDNLREISKATGLSIDDLLSPTVRRTRDNERIRA